MRVHGTGRWVEVLSWLGCGGAVLLACGGQGEDVAPGADGDDAVERAEDPGPSSSGEGAPQGGGTPNSFSQCPTPMGTAEELARTPRSDTNLELLALTLDVGQLTATEPTYARVVADVSVIRGSAPSLADLAFSSPHDGHSFTITFGSDATDALAAGTYTAWDCLLEAYGVRVGSVVDVFGGYAPTLYLDGIFDLPRVAQLFDELPDASVEMSTSVAQSRLCAARDGEHFEYVVDETNGRCDSSECTGRARYFASDAAGDVALLEAWGSVEPAPAPSWLRAVCN